MLPFKQKHVSDSKVVRTFSADTPSEELKWHRDAEDRVVTPLRETDWMVQLDNELPRRIEGSITIPAGVYHRVIKGTGNLHVEIEKSPKAV